MWVFFIKNAHILKCGTIYVHMNTKSIIKVVGWVLVEGKRKLLHVYNRSNRHFIHVGSPPETEVFLSHVNNNKVMLGLS